MNEKDKTTQNIFFKPLLTTLSDEAISEPELSKLIGFDDCKNCFFRNFFLEHVTQGVMQLRRGQA